MKIKTKFLITVVACVATLTSVFEALAVERGEKAFGVRTGFVSRNTSANAGLFFQYTFSQHFRLQPAVDIVFRHKDRDAFTIDLDAQIPFNFSTSRFDLYPYAGLNYSSWNRHYLEPYAKNSDLFSDDVSTRANRFGLNLGAGFDLRLTENMLLNFQFGYTLIKCNSGVRALVGLGYIF